MSLVTEAGLSAQAAEDAAAEALSVKLLDYITDGPKTPQQMATSFLGPAGNTDLVQEAMWLLLDSGQASITADRRLERTI